eukprot:g42666.t1
MSKTLRVGNLQSVGSMRIAQRNGRLTNIRIGSNFRTGRIRVAKCSVAIIDFEARQKPFMEKLEELRKTSQRLLEKYDPDEIKKFNKDGRDLPQVYPYLQAFFAKTMQRSVLQKKDG